MLKKLKEIDKRFLLGGSTCAIVSSIPTFAFATEADPLETVSTAFSTWADGLINSITAMLTSTVGKALVPVGIGISIVLAVKFFKRVTSKA